VDGQEAYHPLPLGQWKTGRYGTGVFRDGSLSIAALVSRRQSLNAFAASLDIFFGTSVNKEKQWIWEFFGSAHVLMLRVSPPCPEAWMLMRCVVFFMASTGGLTSGVAHGAWNVGELGQQGYSFYFLTDL